MIALWFGSDLFTLKTAVKGDQTGAGAQKPKRFWADAPFSTLQLPFLGSRPSDWGLQTWPRSPYNRPVRGFLVKTLSSIGSHRILLVEERKTV
jgi:hypothetical protein